jgi:PAP2 superfamily
MNGPQSTTIVTPARIKVLPHEWVFGGFLALATLRLLAAGAVYVWTLLFAGCLLGSVAVIVWAGRRPGPVRTRVRLLYYPLVMGITFFALGKVLPLPGCMKVDSMLLGWDRAMLGETPSVAWEPWLRPWLVDISMAGYLFFFYYLIAGPGYYCVRDLTTFRINFVGLFTLYGLAFTGYLFFPAGGPHRFMTFSTPLDGPLLLNWTLKPVNDGSNTVDVFPSVHFAASLYLLLFDWRHHRRRFWWVLLPCGVLWFSTMYLRFHYFVDLLVGVPVALAGWGMAQWYERSAATKNTEDTIRSQQPLVAKEQSIAREAD